MSITRPPLSRCEAEDSPVQILDVDGKLLPDAELPPLSEDELLEIYEHMRIARHFDERALSIQRQGRIATYAPMAGQEGAQVASAYALEDRDWIYPTYRDNAAKVVHGFDYGSILAALAGYGDGYAIEDDVTVMPEYIPIATQIPQAMGGAWASKLRGEDRVFLSYLGDGATSEGDFHEGLNFAGVFDVPAVFFCNNNQWAISTPRDRQTRSETLAQKADAYGIEGVQVDGMDPLAVYEVTRRAVEKARNPGDDELRPTFIEALEYRYGAHTTSDDPHRYRGDVPDQHRDRDPIPRLGTFLREYGLLDDEKEAAIEDRAEQRVVEAIEAAESYEDDPAKMFEHVYGEVPQDLERQRAELQRLREKYGDDGLLG